MNVTYDSRNRVVRRTSPNGTLNLTYSGWNLIEERNVGGELQQTYLHGAGVDEMLVKVSSSGPAYYHHDGLGSTVALTGENGELLESYRYDAFGGVSVMNASGLSLPVSGFQNRFLFTGREWLGQAGIYDYRNRVYSASLGRFLQADPIRFSAGDVNLYRYVSNNPINLNDPLGLFQSSSWLSWVPGQQSWDNAVTNLQNGNYGAAAANFAAMLGEQALSALTLGESGAGTAAAGSFCQVSRWGRQGLQSGDWVMNGEASRWNYTFSGKYQPQSWPGGNIPASYSSGQNFTVPSYSLQNPSGFFGPAKGLIGQRIYRP
jgi:RHS repeat-associated protein